MSNNLDLDQVASHQASAEVTINDQAGQLDAALTEVTTVTVDNTNALTLTATQLRRANMIVLTDAVSPPSATVTITLPAIERGLFVVRNGLTTYSADVKVTGQVADIPNLVVGDCFVLHSDGIKVRQVGGGGTGTFVLLDGTSTMTGDLVISDGAGKEVRIASQSATTAEISTEAAFLYLTCDSDSADYTFSFSAAQFVPEGNGDCELGDTSFHWEKLWTNAVDCTGDVDIKNQNRLRLYETGSTNYMGFKAPSAVTADVTLTLPDGDAATAGSFMESNAAGVLSWKQPPYDFAGFFAGVPGVSELITRIVVNRTVVMPTSLTGSQGYISVAATAQTDFDILVNGVSKGTMRFAAAANTATFIFASPVTLVAGDLLSIVAPNPADATAANLSFSFKCYRTN